MAGLTDSGFEIKSFDEIKTELEEKFKTIFGDDINLASTSLLSQQIGVFSKEIYDVWQNMLDVYQSRFPDTSTGTSLDHLVSLSGLERLQNFKSSGSIYLSGDVGTVIPSGTLFSNELGQNVETSYEVTLEEGVAPIFSVSQEEGNTAESFVLSIASDFSGVYESRVGESETISFTANEATVTQAVNTLFGSQVVASVVVATDKVTVTLNSNLFLPVLNVAAGVLTLDRAGLPDGISVGAVASEDGPIVFPVYAIDQIVTPVEGLRAVVNLQDFIVGRLRETDVELRRRWRERIEAPATSSGAAIRNAIRDLSGVSQAFVFEEEGEIEIVVSGGDDQEIATTIQRIKPVGTLTKGSETVVLTDENNNPKNIYFSRPVLKPIFVQINITGGDDFPLDGEEQVRSAITGFFETFSIGGVLRPSPNMIWALQGIPGISNLSITLSEDNTAFSSNPITLQNNEQAFIDELTITIT